MKSKKMISLTLAGMMVLPMVAYGSEDPAGQICQKLLDQKIRLQQHQKCIQTLTYQRK